jgi:putative membrane protein
MDHRARDVTGRTLAASVVGGFFGGLGGSAVMSAAHGLLRRPPPSAGEEDATVKVAEALSRILTRRPLPERARPFAASAVHYGFGAMMGAVQGAVAPVAPLATIGAGVGFGAAVWGAAHAIVVPALGLAPSPLRRRPGQEGLELALHLVYGACAEGVRRVTVRLLG